MLSTSKEDIMSRKEMKALARLQIEGKIGSMFWVSLVGSLIASLGSGLPIVGIIISMILSAAISLGLIYIHFRIASDPSYKPRVRDLFDGFNNFWPFLKVSLLASLFTFLWALLFFIPGMVKALAYSQAPYIIAENPNMPAMEALRISERMMSGRKWEYFVLNLSFIGWAFLAIPTLGLLMIWLEPYMQMTMVNFYSDCKAKFGPFFYAPPPPPPPPPPFGEQI
jgi:uncharacterized membrane protein